MKISIVTPVYNPPIERLRAAVSSVMEQLHDDWELLLIDDGSDDAKILTYLSEFSRSDARIRLHRQENSGPSAARNLGTQMAIGEYITYLDADDELTSWALADAARVISATGCDLIMGSVQYIDSETEKSHERNDDHRVLDSEAQQAFYDYILSGIDRSGFTRGSRVGIKNGPVARCIRGDVAKAVLFRAGLHISEDTIWNLELIAHASSITMSSSIWYWYWVSHDSTSRGYREDAPEQTMLFLEALAELLQSPEHHPTPQNVLLRILGEVNRTTRTYLARPECPLTLREKLRTPRRLLRAPAFDAYATLANALRAGAKCVVKYFLALSGLGLLYWRVRA